MGWACGLVALTVALATTGAVLLLWATYDALAAALGLATARALTGLLALVMAGLCAWIAERIAR